MWEKAIVAYFIVVSWYLPSEAK